MALQGMGYNINYAGSQSIIYWVANGETAERNKISLKKFHVNRIFVPHADFELLARFKTIVISNEKAQLFLFRRTSKYRVLTLILLVSFLAKRQNMTCVSP